MKIYENYIAKTKCSNCHATKRMKIPRGKRIEEMICPHCGIQSLQSLSYFEAKYGRTV